MSSEITYTDLQLSKSPFVRKFSYRGLSFYLGTYGDDFTTLKSRVAKGESGVPMFYECCASYIDGNDRWVYLPTTVQDRLFHAYMKREYPNIGRVTMFETEDAPLNALPEQILEAVDTFIAQLPLHDQLHFGLINDAS